MFLDNQHHLISFEELFFGTIDSASVYPREVVKAALKTNAAAVIFAHNHPSGYSDDASSTKRLERANSQELALFVCLKPTNEMRSAVKQRANNSSKQLVIKKPHIPLLKCVAV